MQKDFNFNFTLKRKIFDNNSMSSEIIFSFIIKYILYRLIVFNDILK